MMNLLCLYQKNPSRKCGHVRVSSMQQQQIGQNATQATITVVKGVDGQKLFQLRLKRKTRQGTEDSPVPCHEGRLQDSLFWLFDEFEYRHIGRELVFCHEYLFNTCGQKLLVSHFPTVPPLQYSVEYGTGQALRSPVSNDSNDGSNVDTLGMADAMLVM